MTTTKKKPALKVPGHTLVYEGAPFDNTGKRIGWTGTGGWGYGRCSCGYASRWEYEFGSERKAWHNEHKRAVMDPDAYDAWIEAVDKWEHPC